MISREKLYGGTNINISVVNVPFHICLHAILMFTQVLPQTWCAAAHSHSCLWMTIFTKLKHPTSTTNHFTFSVYFTASEISSTSTIFKSVAAGRTWPLKNKKIFSFKYQCFMQLLPLVDKKCTALFREKNIDTVSLPFPDYDIQYIMNINTYFYMTMETWDKKDKLHIG